MNITCAICILHPNAWMNTAHEQTKTRSQHFSVDVGCLYSTCFSFPLYAAHLFMARRRRFFVKVQFLEHHFCQPKKMAATKTNKEARQKNITWPALLSTGGIGFFLRKRVGHLCPKKNNTKKLLRDSAHGTLERKVHLPTIHLQVLVSGRVCLLKSESLDSICAKQKNPQWTLVSVKDLEHHMCSTYGISWNIYPPTPSNGLKNEGGCLKWHPNSHPFGIPWRVQLYTI